MSDKLSDFPALAVAQLQLRFWSRVDIRKGSLCWLWTGETVAARGGCQRPRIDFQGRKLLAYRVAWLLTAGELPDPSQFILHSCDNPLCVRPDHLSTGTHEENMKEMITRERVSRGEEHPNAKLTDADVLRVFDLFAQGQSNQEIADVIGKVGRGAIQKIRSGQRWSHLSRSPF